MKKLFALALATTLLCTLLAACGGDSAQDAGDTPTPQNTAAEGGANEAASGDEINLKFSIWDYDSIAYFDIMKDRFEAENPGITIEFINTTANEYVDKLTTMLNGGSDLDLILIKETDAMHSLYNKGQLADLTPYIEASGVDLTEYAGIAEYFNFDGVQTALPFRKDYYILYYNKGIFDAANEPYLGNDMTWDDFEQVAGRLTTGEGADKQYGAFLHVWPACVQNWAVQDGKNTIMGPDYAFMADTYERALRMQASGDIPDYGTLTSAQIHYSSAFQTGTAGMVPMGSWFISGMINAKNNGETDVEWGIATLPHPEGMAPGNTVGSTTPVAINNASDKKDAAWKFVEFATGDEGARILAEHGQFSGRSSDELLDIITSVDGMPEGAAEALQVENIVLDRPIQEYVNEVNAMLGEVHGLIMLEEVSVEEGLAMIATQSAEIQAG